MATQFQEQGITTPRILPFKLKFSSPPTPKRRLRQKTRFPLAKKTSLSSFFSRSVFGTQLQYQDGHPVWRARDKPHEFFVSFRDGYNTGPLPEKTVKFSWCAYFRFQHAYLPFKFCCKWQQRRGGGQIYLWIVNTAEISSPFQRKKIKSYCSLRWFTLSTDRHRSQKHIKADFLVYSTSWVGIYVWTLWCRAEPPPSRRK